MADAEQEDQRERLRRLVPGLPGTDGAPNAPARSPLPSPSGRRGATVGRRILDWRLPGLPPGLGTLEWLAAGAFRLPFATAAALITTWTALVFALWIAVYSAIGSVALLLTGTAASGHVVGVFTFTEHTGASLTVLGILTALFAGFAFGFADAYTTSLRNGLPDVALAMLIGIILGMVIGLVAMLVEPSILRARGYRRPSRKEWETKLEPAVEAVMEGMRLSSHPLFMLTDTPVPLAWTVARHVVLSTGLLQTADAAELQGVLAHEFAHWQRGDGIALRMVWSLSWPLAATYHLGMVLSGANYGTPQTPADVAPQKGKATVISVIGWFFLWPSYVLIRYVVGPATAHGSRAMEYEADAAVVRAGLSTGLRRYLESQPPFEVGRSAWEAVLSASHPPIQLRLEAIEDVDPDEPAPEIQEVSRKQAGTLVGIAVLLLALFISHFIPHWNPHIRHTHWWEPW